MCRCLGWEGGRVGGGKKIGEREKESRKGEGWSFVGWDGGWEMGDVICNMWCNLSFGFGLWVLGR